VNIHNMMLSDRKSDIRIEWKQHTVRPGKLFGSLGSIHIGICRLGSIGIGIGRLGSIRRCRLGSI